jgi:hypothetical protein
MSMPMVRLGKAGTRVSHICLGTMGFETARAFRRTFALTGDGASMGGKTSLPDAALIITSITGLWFFMGYMKRDSYLVKMGVPSGVVFLEPQTYLILGFISSLLIATGALLCLLVFFFIGQRRVREKSSKPRYPSLLGMAALTLVLSSSFYYGFEVVSYDRKPIHVGPVTFLDPREIVLLLLLAAFAGFAGWAVTKDESRPPRIASWDGMVGSGFALVVVFAITMAAMGASIEGNREASDALWRVTPYEVVTLHSTNSAVDNTTFYFVAETQSGVWVHDLTDIGGKNHTARFVPMGTLSSIDVEVRSP